MEKIPWKPKCSLEDRPLQGLSYANSHTKESDKRVISLKKLSKKESKEDWYLEYKFKEQKLYFIAAIAIIIIFFILILMNINDHKPACSQDDLQCQDYYEHWQGGAYH